MEKIIRGLYLLSAGIIFIAGIYINIVFEDFLSSYVRGMLWIGLLVFWGVQIEFGYGVVRRYFTILLRQSD